MNGILEAGFLTGCNYWASNAGCFMWSQWDEKIVEKDFSLLAQNGLKTLRVFPLWSDFQPLRVLYGEFGQPREIRCRENPLSHDPCGQARVAPEMVQRFEILCRLAEKHKIDLTVMILTGWMSGRQFKPEPLQALNTFTDPFSLMWQVRFVSFFVSHFRDFPAIAAWGLGNESNIMSDCPNREAAYSWTALIANTIRKHDPNRPVISGMHGLTVSDPNNPWKIADQGEHCDIVTTHPYSLFVPHCDYDSLASLRSTFHPAAESTLYSDISGKPCMSEEIGDLGRSMVSEDLAKMYLDTILRSCWANDNLGCLWWTAFQFDHLEKAPYDWTEFEKDLGLFHSDFSPKPALKSYLQFHDILAELPGDAAKLPPRRRDAVCLLSHGQDHWATALGAFILSKQAGFDLQFCAPEAPIPQSDLYLLPSISGLSPLTAGQRKQLLENIENGADLYISCRDALAAPFTQMAGLEIQTRKVRTSHPTIILEDQNLELTFPMDSNALVSVREGGIQTGHDYELTLKPTTAQVLAWDKESKPAFTVNQLGNGRVFFLNVGMEILLTSTPGCFEADAPHFHALYRIFAEKILSKRLIRKPMDLKDLDITEHPLSSDNILCVAVNHSFEKKEIQIQCTQAYKNIRFLHGKGSLKGPVINLDVQPGKCVVMDCKQ